MKIIFKPKSNLEKFGEKIFNLLVENFLQTFFVGGMVRDLILKKRVLDIDITTSALPEQIIKILNDAGISTDDSFKKFGNIVAKQGTLSVEITTLRTDLVGEDRYTKVKFIKSSKQDSKRRDFTINSLYLKGFNGQLSDYQKGLSDIKNKLIRFIGNPKIKIKQDPLRIVRALRFALVLDFNLEKKTKIEIKNSFHILNNLTKSKIEKEILKIKLKSKQEILKQVLNNPAYLDKRFK